MSLGRLVWRQLAAHPVRCVITILAVGVAMFLFCFLRSIVTSLDSAVKASASNRIITASAVSLFQSLPASYGPQMSAMQGVESVSRFNWFGGLYKDESGFFAQFGCDAETIVDQYPELLLPEAERAAWFEDRKGCIVGVGLADKYGWKVGDEIPLIGTIYPRTDGSQWTFTCRGIYRSAKPNLDEMTLYFHWDYLNETLERGDAQGPRGVSVYILKLRDGVRGEDVAAAVDAYYEGGPQRTRTQSEAAFQADFVNMLGNLPTFLGMIGAAVLLAILLGIVNTMTIAARERTRTTGILKALGFQDSVPARLYLLESIALVGAGAVLGVALSLATVVAFRQRFGTQIPVYDIAAETLGLAVLLTVAIGLAGGLVPALRALTLRSVEALRRGM
jgi:putative ABC transport system permease protein